MRIIAGALGAALLFGCVPPVPGFQFAHFPTKNTLQYCQPMIGGASGEEVRKDCGEPLTIVKTPDGRECWTYPNHFHGISIGSPAPYVAACFTVYGDGEYRELMLEAMLALGSLPGDPAKATDAQRAALAK